MKLLITGSRNLCGKEENAILTNEVKKYLDQRMSSGDSLLIGSDPGVDVIVQKYISSARYKQVTIYQTGSREDQNTGGWKEKRFRKNEINPVLLRTEKNFAMVEDAEEGLVIWNGESIGTFITMLCLLAQRKKCRLYMINEHKWIHINAIEELRGFAGDERVITDKEMREALEKCGYSGEVASDVDAENCTDPYQVADKICVAPISFDKKISLLTRMSNNVNIKWNAYESLRENIAHGRSYKRIKHDIRAVLAYRGTPSIWIYLAKLSDELLKAEAERYGTLDDILNGIVKI